MYHYSRQVSHCPLMKCLFHNTVASIVEVRNRYLVNCYLILRKLVTRILVPGTTLSCFNLTKFVDRNQRRKRFIMTWKLFRYRVVLIVSVLGGVISYWSLTVWNSPRAYLGEDSNYLFNYLVPKRSLMFSSIHVFVSFCVEMNRFTTYYDIPAISSLDTPVTTCVTLRTLFFSV